MALSKSALSDLLDALRAGGDLDLIREGLALVLQALIDAEATQHIGARPYERSEQRTTHRNGSRSRLLSTKAGDVELRIPKLREGSFFPALLEPRRRIDRALLAVVMEAYVHGTSTRKVDDLVKALGVDAGISKSEVSRICAELDGEVAGFRSRSLAHTGFPYVFLDATYLKARVDGRVVSRAVVIATGVTADGGREVLGLDVGDSEDGAFWTAFLRSLKARGLPGVQLVISDAHTGLKAAIAAVMAGASWQRCRVHFLRNVLARVPKGSAEMVAAAIRTIFAQPTGAEVIDQVDKVAAMLASKFSAVAAMLTDAKEDLTAFAAFPTSHWVKIWSTDERFKALVCCRPAGTGLASWAGVVDPGAKSRALGLEALPRSLPLEGPTSRPSGGGHAPCDRVVTWAWPQAAWVASPRRAGGRRPRPAR
jgi:putative transposase